MTTAAELNRERESPPSYRAARYGRKRPERIFPGVAVDQKKMNMLLLVHIEEMFRDPYAGINDPYIRRVLRVCRQVDHVVHFTSNVGGHGMLPELKEYVNQEIEWTWGYEAPDSGYYVEEDVDEGWIIPSNGHEWTWVPLKLREPGFWRPFDRILLGGGCNGSCLMDMEEILEHLDIAYDKVREIVYC